MLYKCKMCGGDIEQINNSNTGKCLYCKSLMTLPVSDNEKIVNLYNRANDFRLSNNFDKASGIYETILELDNTQVEAHWGLLLCKYGVEYVDDPKTGKKIPTCHRTIPSSILKDKEFEIIKKESYGDALKLYEEEANRIAEIQKHILEISSMEEPYDIFICYKESDDKGERTPDSVIAQDIYDKLVEKDYKVFFARISLEDKLGTEYEPYIYSALNSAKIMLVVGTKEEFFNAVWVKNEWSRFIEMMKKDKSKSLIPVYSKIDAYKIPEEFAMYQAQSMDKVGAMQDLIRGIDKIMQDNKSSRSDQLTYEMYEKFKKMKEEEEEAIRESKEANKQVELIVERPKKIYSYLYFIFSFIQAITILMINIRRPIVKNIYGNYSLSKLYTSNDIPTILILIICINTFIAFFLSISNKKTNIAAKILYSLNIVYSFIILTFFNNIGFKVLPIFVIFSIMNVLLLLIMPRWRLKSKIDYVTTDDKKRIIENNKVIKNNFTEKLKKPIFLIVIEAISLTLLGIGIILNSTYILKSQGNERNSAYYQLQVVNEYINIRKKASKYESKLGVVYEGEIYTILDEVKEKNSTWYKIKTKNGITGYIYSGNNNENIILLD